MISFFFSYVHIYTKSTINVQINVHWLRVPRRHLLPDPTESLDPFPLGRHVKRVHPFRQRPHVVPMPSFFVHGASEQPHDYLGRSVVQGPTAHHGTRLVQQRGRLFSDEPKGGNGRPSVLVGHQFEPRPVVLVVDKDGFGLSGKHSIDFDDQLHRPARTPTQCARVVHILEPSKRVQGVRLLDDDIVASKEI